MSGQRPLAAMAFMLAIGSWGSASATIVARDILITMDQTDPSHTSDMGKVHEARIYDDDTKIDPVTHHVAILHEQHTPMLIPFHPDAAEMPVSNAWLDLSAKPYRYHMAASPAVKPLPDGRTMWKPYAIVFDEDTRRMTIRRQSDGGLELSGNYVVSDEVLSGPKVDFVIFGSGPPPGMKRGPAGMGGAGDPPRGAGAPDGAPSAPGPMASEGHAGSGQQPEMPAGMKMPPPPPPLVVKRGRLVALGIDIIVDQVAPEDLGMYQQGQHDTARIVYNEADVDPVTKMVSILEESHLIKGHYHPNRETRASTLDMSQIPYRLTYISAPFHGRPLVVAFEGATQRMAMLARPDFHMLIAGHYTIDPKPIAYDAKHPEN